MAPDVRRASLVRAAVSVIAAHGYTDFPLEEIAEHAGVTRNLLYHYFPAGRTAIFAAAADWSGSELTDGWVTDADVPLAERIARNFARMAEHAAGPSEAWLLYRYSRTVADPEVVAVIDGHLNAMVNAIARNHLGEGVEPSRVLRVALLGYLAGGEMILDEGRDAGLTVAEIQGLLTRTLIATIAAAEAGAS